MDNRVKNLKSKSSKVDKKGRIFEKIWKRKYIFQVGNQEGNRQYR